MFEIKKCVTQSSSLAGDAWLCIIQIRAFRIYRHSVNGSQSREHCNLIEEWIEGFVLVCQSV